MQKNKSNQAILRGSVTDDHIPPPPGAEGAAPRQRPSEPGARASHREQGSREMNEAVIETVQTLCREGNRDSVLTVFQNFPEHFSCIPLNDSNVESKQAINDLLRENVRKEPNNNAENTHPRCCCCCC